MAADLCPTPKLCARAPGRWLVRAALTFALAGCAHRPCAAPARLLRGAWDDAHRERLLAAMNEVPGERAGKLAAAADLERLAAAWTDTRTATCEGATRATRATVEARMACQDLARGAPRRAPAASRTETARTRSAASRCAAATATPPCASCPPRSPSSPASSASTTPRRDAPSPARARP